MSKTIRYTSLNEILERVRRDFGFEEVYPDECKEWIWDAIGFMGSTDLLIPKTVKIQIHNHRGELPVDVFDLSEHMVREVSSGEVMRYSENLYHLSDSIEVVDPMIIYDATSVVITDNGVDSQGETNYISIIAPQYKAHSLEYNIKGNYIFTALRSLEVELAYTAFPMDENTMEPLIPDTPKVIRAVVYYIADKIAFKLMLQDKLSERKYAEIKQEYLFNTASAITSSKISTIPQIENFKNKVISLMKNQFPYKGAFKH
jgi:hypothetical protein